MATYGQQHRIDVVTKVAKLISQQPAPLVPLAEVMTVKHSH